MRHSRVLFSATMLIAMIAAGCDRPADETGAEAAAATVQTATTEPVAISDRSRQLAREAIADGAAMGDGNLKLMAALEEHQPDIYNDFVEVMAVLLEQENYNEEDAYAAGTTVRPKLMEAFGQAMLTASDENVVDLVEHTVLSYESLLQTNPQECVRNLNGLPPLHEDVISDASQKRESELMLKIFEEGPVEDDFAPQDELMDWMVPRLQANPDHLAAFSLDQGSELSDEDAAALCRATIFVMQEMLKEDRPETARLFRGSARL